MPSSRKRLGDILGSRWPAPLAVAAACLLAYAPYIAVAPLLDERFLLEFARNAGRHAVSLSEFVLWRGPAPADLWGVGTTLFLKLSTLVLGGVMFLLRLQGVLLHGVAAVLLYFFASPLLRNRLVALPAAVIFAVFPLNAEAVLWLDGRGSELAGVLFIASALAYTRARSDWRWLLAAFLLYAVSISCSASVWLLALYFPLYELFVWLVLREPGDGADKNLAVMAPLGFLFLPTAYIAATGYYAQLADTAAPVLRAPVVLMDLRACLFPINESIWTHYASQYRLLYFLYAPAAVAAVWCAKSFPRLLNIFGFVLLWFVLAVAPAIGHFAARDTNSGSHLLYPAMLPLALLFAMVFASIAAVVGDGKPAPVAAAEPAPVAAGTGRVLAWPYLAGTLATLFSCAFAAFLLTHTWKQCAAYDSGGRLLKAFARSLKVAATKTTAPYIVACDLPQRLALAPGYSMAQLPVFERATGLLSCSRVAAGKLKDALRDGRWTDAAFQWNNERRGLMPLQTGDRQHPQTAELKLGGKAFAARLQPPLEYYKIAHLDQSTGELVLDTNSPTTGAAVQISADEIPPLGPDFLYIDARIDAPRTLKAPSIELYWRTAEHTNYDNKQRRVVIGVIPGDGQYHRYYLPLRSSGWLSAGPATSLTLGFPPGAKVFLREFGTTRKENAMPTFDFLPAAEQPTSPQFFPPFYKFAAIPELGTALINPSDKLPSWRHDCSGIPGADGIMVEISMPDKAFPNPNGNRQSGVASATFGIRGVRGTWQVPLSYFPQRGLYSVRAIAIDSKQQLIGNFSDEWYCLVTRPYKTAWETQ